MSGGIFSFAFVVLLTHQLHDAAPLSHTPQVLPYEAIACKQCSAVLNPYARVDFYSKVLFWPCELSSEV